MYSPKIREELIPIIYREAKKKKVPMTTFVSDIIYNHFYHLPEEQEIGLQSNNKQGDNSDSLCQGKEGEQETRRADQ